jgi:hypothetical protein
MLKKLLPVLLVLVAHLGMAQTQLRLSNISIGDKDGTRQGTEVSASLRGAEGKRPITLYADQEYELSGSFKVVTHNVRRQSAKQGAVYLTMNMVLKVDGKRNKRVVQKTFYADQDRTASFEEAFLIKRGIDVRKITVKFDGRID